MTLRNSLRALLHKQDLRGREHDLEVFEEAGLGDIHQIHQELVVGRRIVLAIDLGIAGESALGLEAEVPLGEFFFVLGGNLGALGAGALLALVGLKPTAIILGSALGAAISIPIVKLAAPHLPQPPITQDDDDDDDDGGPTGPTHRGEYRMPPSWFVPRQSFYWEDGSHPAMRWPVSGPSAPYTNWRGVNGVW